MSHYLVLTETSSYVVDTDDMWVQRRPGQGAGQDPNEEVPAVVHDLRRDGDVIPLVELLALEEGRPMVMLLDVRGDGVVTLRRTTNVMSITEV